MQTQKAMWKIMRTIALNCLEESKEPSEAGHAVQLQLAAHAAFGKA